MAVKDKPNFGNSFKLRSPIDVLLNEITTLNKLIRDKDKVIFMAEKSQFLQNLKMAVKYTSEFSKFLKHRSPNYFLLNETNRVIIC